MKKNHNEVEESVSEAAEELHVELPGGRFPLPAKLIILLTTIGGLSIMGSLLADIITPARTGAGSYLLRALTGIAVCAVAYGLSRRQRWAVWVYGFAALAGLFINPIVAIVPIAFAAYLVWQRRLFHASPLERSLASRYESLERRAKKGLGTR